MLELVSRLRSVFHLSLLRRLALIVFKPFRLSRVGKNLEKFFRLSVMRVGGKFFLRFFPKIPRAKFSPWQSARLEVVEVARRTEVERKKNQPAINLRVQAVLQNKGSYPLNPARLAKMERAVWRVGYSGRKSIPRKGEINKNKAGKGEWTNWRRKRLCG